MGVNEDDLRPRRSTTSSRTRRARRTAWRRSRRCFNDVFGIERGLDDDGARLHGRPEPPGRPPPRPPPRTRGGDQHRADLAPAPRRPSASCSPSSSASSTASHCACRCPPARSPTSPSRASRPVTGRRGQGRLQGRRRGPAEGHPRSTPRTRSSRATSCPTRTRRSSTPDSPRVIGNQVKLVELVRQRVGLLEPARRPHRVRRRTPLNRAIVTLRTIDSPSVRSPASASSSVVTSTFLSRTGSSRTTAVSAHRSQRSRRLLGAGRPRRSWSPTSAALRARPTRSTASRRSRLDSASCSTRRSHSRPTRSVRMPPRAKVAALGRRRGARAREPAFQSGGETSKNEAERTGVRRRVGGFRATPLVSDGFGVVHRKQASVYELEELRPSAPVS